MTVAAGFVCTDGILLCADTEYSGAFQKAYKPKFFPHAFEHGSAVFGLVGHEVNSQMVIRDCRYALEKNPRSIQEIEAIFRTAVKDNYDRYVASLGDIEERNAAYFDVLMAVRIEGAEPELFCSSADGVEAIDQFVCRGSGYPAGEYLIQRSYVPPFALCSALALGLGILSAAKHTSAGVGGYSQFISVTKEKRSQVFSADLDEVAEELRQLEFLSGGLLLSFGNLTRTEEQFRADLEHFRKSVLEQRSLMMKKAAVAAYYFKNLCDQSSNESNSGSSQA
jgi:hypothetical protein